LKDFKTSPEQTLATALGGITIEEDDLSDEYDFMDEDEEATQRRQQEKESRRTPQLKYRNMLQKLANREIEEITIELDDLAEVRTPPPWSPRAMGALHANRYAVGAPH
jgi:DNA replication licensing factor MCM7